MPWYSECLATPEYTMAAIASLIMRECGGERFIWETLQSELSGLWSGSGFGKPWLCLLYLVVKDYYLLVKDYCPLEGFV